MQKHDLLFAALLGFGQLLFAQGEDIYLGAGYPTEISVTTSNNHQLYSGIQTAVGEHTINGEGLEEPEMEAARFLSQATLGFSQEMLDEVVIPSGVVVTIPYLYTAHVWTILLEPAAQLQMIGSLVAHKQE